MSPHVLGPVRPIALIGMLLVSTAGLALDTQAAAAAECLTAPKAHTPSGSHWYYHTDRATGRKCWFLRGPSGQQQAAATGASAKPTTGRLATAGAKSTSNSSCLAAPNHAAPKGSHWYYHQDRATNRKCWHLRETNSTSDAATAAPKSDAVPAVPATQTPQPAAAAAPAAPAKRDSVWSAAPAKLQSVTLANGMRDNRQNGPDTNRTAQAATPAPAKPQAPAASAAAPQGGSHQAAETTGVSDRESEERPVVVDSGNAIVPALPTRDARAESPPSPNDRPASGAAKGTAPANDATVRTANADQGKNISPPMSASAPAPLGIVPIVALALVAAGILYRILLKLLAMRGPRVIVDRSGDDWGEKRYEEASTVPQQVTEDPAPSLAPPVAEMKFRYPRVTGDAWLRDGRGSRIVPAKPNGEHDEHLAAFMRDLDQLLQTRNGK